MPLYEYQCDECGRRLERIQKFSDPPLTECPDCRGLLRKLLSSPAIQFKGSGWYVTDYAKTTKGEKSESESAAPEAKADKPEKTEKKTKESSPAKKTPDKPSSSKASTGD